MRLTNNEMLDFAKMVAQAVVEALGQQPKVESKKSDKTAYQKTEQLLYNYVGFKRIVEEKQREIEELRVHGLPKKSGSIVAYTPHVGTVGQIVLPEESVESAVHNIECAIQHTVQAIARIDKCMDTLRNDPYYDVLEMRYFEGRTLEDIGAYFGCDHTTISRNRSRLVKELAMQLFPDDIITEYMN